MSLGKIPLKFRGYRYCLVSISGDMSAHGMGTINTVYPFQRHHKKIVKDLLRAQLKWEEVCCFEDSLGMHNQKAIVRNTLAYHDACWNKLKEAGIFKCKYDARTNWKVTWLNEVELAEYEPWRIGI